VLGLCVLGVTLPLAPFSALAYFKALLAWTEPLYCLLQGRQLVALARAFSAHYSARVLVDEDEDAASDEERSSSTRAKYVILCVALLAYAAAGKLLLDLSRTQGAGRLPLYLGAAVLLITLGSILVSRTTVISSTALACLHLCSCAYVAVVGRSPLLDLVTPLVLPAGADEHIAAAASAGAAGGPAATLPPSISAALLEARFLGPRLLAAGALQLVLLLATRGLVLWSLALPRTQQSVVGKRGRLEFPPTVDWRAVAWSAALLMGCDMLSRVAGLLFAQAAVPAVNLPRLMGLPTQRAMLLLQSAEAAAGFISFIVSERRDAQPAADDEEGEDEILPPPPPPPPSHQHQSPTPGSASRRGLPTPGAEISPPRRAPASGSGGASRSAGRVSFSEGGADRSGRTPRAQADRADVRQRRGYATLDRLHAAAGDGE
jgi:uncharacterized membrane protein YgcG